MTSQHHIDNLVFRVNGSGVNALHVFHELYIRSGGQGGEVDRHSVNAAFNGFPVVAVAYLLVQLQMDFLVGIHVVIQQDFLVFGSQLFVRQLCVGSSQDAQLIVAAKVAV